MSNKQIGRIRNGEMRRDFKRLLGIIADAPMLSRNHMVEQQRLEDTIDIAEKYDLYFDDYGNVKEMRR